MESVKLYDSEWKLMEILWEGEPVSARDLAVLAAERIGWNKKTTYTIIKKLVEKGVIRREEPGLFLHFAGSERGSAEIRDQVSDR